MMRMKTARTLILAAAIAGLTALLCKRAIDMVIEEQRERLEDATYPEVLQCEDPSPTQYSARMKWWADARLGLFVHWGPVSLTGHEISWSRGDPIPVETYDNLYKKFNPMEFSPDEWVETAKAAGAGYIVFTAKHHDGFSMFDTGLSEYKITNSPFKRDVSGELAEACHRVALRIGFYYSLPDWHHDDYGGEDHERYLQYLHGQIGELCGNYGPVDVIWFDNPAYMHRDDDHKVLKTAADWNGSSLFGLIRERQPDAIINDRCGLPGDFNTREQEIGEFQDERPWEAAVTLCTQWAWKPDDRMKSLGECVATLVRVAGRDGNLLLNVGPMPTGEIEPRQAERLREIGRWLDQYGESIRGTRGGPFAPGPWGASTQRGDRVYIHVLNWRSGRIQFPPFRGRRILRGALLTGGEMRLKETRKLVTINVPRESWDGIDTIIALDLEPPTEEP